MERKENRASPFLNKCTWLSPIKQVMLINVRIIKKSTVGRLGEE